MELIAGFVLQYPELAGLLSILYVLGLCNKPLFSFLHTLVDATETAKDNEFLARLEASKGYKIVSYVLDWAVRIKLPQEKK